MGRRIPDESDPGVIVIVDGEFAGRGRYQRRRLACLKFEDWPGPCRFRDKLALVDANLKLDDAIDAASGSDDAKFGCAVLTPVDDFQLDRGVDRPPAA